MFSVVWRSKEARVKLNMCLLVKVRRRRHMCLLETQGDTDLSWRHKETHVMVILVGDTRRHRFKMEKQGDTYGCILSKVDHIVSKSQQL